MFIVLISHWFVFSDTKVSIMISGRFKWCKGKVIAEITTIKHDFDKNWFQVEGNSVYLANDEEISRFFKN